MKQFLASVMLGMVAFVLLSSAAPTGAPPPAQAAERIFNSITAQILSLLR
jgi:hypothetical protein